MIGMNSGDIQNQVDNMMAELDREIVKKKKEQQR